MINLILSAVILIGSSVFAEDSQVQLYPSSIYTKEHVTLTFKIRGFAADTKLSVYETDSKGAPLRYIGTLLDEGFGGDRKAKDGWFSRTFKVMELEPRVSYYAAFEDRSPSPTLVPSTVLDVTIRRRPSFIESVHEIWTRLVNPSSSSGDETPQVEKDARRAPDAPTLGHESSKTD